MHHDDTPSIHRQLRQKAAELNLTLLELNAICQIVSGQPLQYLSTERARIVLATIVAKGPATKQWANELVRSM
jgi:hypothetical protein